MQKSIEEKIRECKQLAVQSLQKTIQSQMIYKFLKEQKIEADLKVFPVLNREGYFILQFKQAQKALNYYETANFKAKPLLRPLNMYLNLTLEEKQMKKYYFDGVTDETLRKMFEAARKFGVCKIYTTYPPGKKSVKRTGVISFIRLNEFTETELSELKESLEQLKIKLSPYNPEKGVKCSVIVSDFYQGNLDEKDEVIEEAVLKELTEKFKKIVKNENDIEKVTPIVKRRHIADPSSKDGAKLETKVRGMIEFISADAAMENFQLIRKAYITEKGNAVLKFHNAENNSYNSLFTKGLRKPEGKQNMTDKQFQDELVDVFKKVHQNIVQVNVYPIAFNKTYVGRLYLKDEQSGKEFIAYYTQKRPHFYKYFKNPENIKFDLNVDNKNQLKMRSLKLKADQVANEIKNAVDAQKRNKKLAANMVPMNMSHGPNLGMPMVYPRSGPQGINQQVMMPQGQFPQGGMFVQGNMPSQGIMPYPRPQAPSLKDKLTKVFQTKDRLISDSTTGQDGEKLVKKKLNDLVKETLEQIMGVKPEEVVGQTEIILKHRSVKEIIQFLEKPQAFYQRIKQPPSST